MIGTDDLDSAVNLQSDSHSAADKEETTRIIRDVSCLVSTASTAECTATAQAVSEAQSQVAEKMLSSQALICSRLHDNISKKKRLLMK